MEHLLLKFLDHTQRRTTVGRTPLDEWSARRRDLYLTTHDTHNRQISMPPVGFEPTISAGERNVCSITFPSTVLFSTLGLATFQTYITALRTFRKTVCEQCPWNCKAHGRPAVLALCKLTSASSSAPLNIIWYTSQKLCQNYSCVVAECVSWQQNMRSVPQPKIFTAKNKNPYCVCLPFINQRTSKRFRPQF